MKPSDILLALIVVLIWGFNFVVIKLGLQGLPPILFTALRFACAALPMVFFVRRPAVPFRLLAGYAAFQFALQFTLLFSGMQAGFPPGLASLVVQLQAFFTIGLAVVVLGERPQWSQIAGALIAFGGMGLVAMHLEARATVLGFLMVIAAGFSWGVGNIFTKRIGKVDALALVVWGSLLAAPPLLLASLAIEGPAAIVAALQGMSWLSAGAILFQAYPTTILGFGIWAILLRKYPTATVAPFTLLVPVAGMVSAAWVLGEPLQWWKVGAGALVLSGLALNQFGPRVMGALAAQK
ncbi:EamA family transporter [Noviherbaspirillum sp.]|uniref:EamA family transporter n=1 Tax=Noviherbaspirillum sp. TaxID=1926288 RepID=UPI002D287AF0|nr:EamA family transporter [Noviherbaspirillum sp.]HZW22227.1 EamA family transporter [Noviherbaspirillum sp.]